MQALLTIIGRFCLVAIFLGSGVSKILDRSGTLDKMNEVGMPNPEIMYLGAVPFLLAGSVSVLLGYRARIGAILLMIFLVLVTWYFHAFWKLPEAEQQTQIIPFLHNLGLFGAFMMIFANGAGPGSLDGRVRGGNSISSD